MKKLLKFVAYSLAMLVALAVTVYFIASSAWFIKGQILPRVSTAAGVPVTAEGVVFSPFSGLEMTGVRIGDASQPLVEVKTVRVRYEALAVLDRKIVVSELLLDGAKLRLAQQPDGAWGLPPQPAAKPAPAGAGSATAFPYALDIRNVRITDAEFSLTQSKPVPTSITLRKINLAVPAVRQGQPLDLLFTALVSASRNDETLAKEMPVTAAASFVFPEKVGTLPAVLDMQFRAGAAVAAAEPPAKSLAAALSRIETALPAVAETLAQFARLPSDGRSAAGAVHLESSTAGYQCDVRLSGKLAPEAATPELVLQIKGKSGAQPLPLTLAVEAEIAPALATIKAFAKFPLTPFTGSYVGAVQVAGPQKIAVNGLLKMANLGLAESAKGMISPVNVEIRHDVSVDLAANAATLTQFHASVRRNQAELLTIALSDPAVIAWGGAKGPEAAPAKLHIALRAFDPATVAALLPANAPVVPLGGMIDAEYDITVAKQGAAITFAGHVAADEIRLRQGDRKLPEFSGRNRISGTFDDFRHVVVEMHPELRLGGAAAFQADIRALADLRDQDGSATIQIPLANERLLAFLPPDSAKDVKAFKVQGAFKLTAAKKFQQITASGEIKVPQLDASLPGGAALPAMQAALTFTAAADLAKSAGSLDQFAFTAAQDGRTVVTTTLSAPLAISWAAKTAPLASDAVLSLTVERLALTQANAFLPPDAPKLASGMLDAKLAVTAAKTGDLFAKGDWSILQLGLASGQGSATIKGALDLAFMPKVRELRILAATLQAEQDKAVLANLAVMGNAFLPPFDNRQMTLTVTGSELNLAALQALAPKSAKKTADAATRPAAGAPAVEPPPVDLKGLRATVAVNLKHVTYHDITIADILTTLEVKDNGVNVQPSTLTFNGAPVSFRGTANLGAAPWKYDLSAKLDKLAIAPLVNSFAPKFKDTISGEVKHVEFAAAGSGITPENLQQNFKGGGTLEVGGFVVQNLQGLVADAVSQKKGLGSLLEFAAKIGLGDMQQLAFDSIKFNLASENGRMQVKEGVLAGPDLRLSLLPGSSIGFDKTLDLTLQVGFSGLIEKNIRQLRLKPLLGQQDGIYYLLPKTIPIKGDFGNPDTSQFDWKKLLLQKGLESGIDALNQAIRAKGEGKKVSGQDILNNLFGNGQSEQPATTTPAPAPQDSTPGTGTAPNATAPAPAPTETPAPPKKKRSALFDLGNSLLQEALKK